MVGAISDTLRSRTQRWTAVLAAVGLAATAFAAVPAQADIWTTVGDTFIGKNCVGDLCIERKLTSVAFPVEPTPQVPTPGATVLVVGTVKLTFAGGEELATVAAGQENPPCDIINATPVTTGCVDSPLGPEEQSFEKVKNLFSQECVWNAKVTITKGGATVFHTDDAKFVSSC